MKEKIKVEEIIIIFTSRKFLETGARKDKKTVSPPHIHLFDCG